MRFTASWVDRHLDNFDKHLSSFKDKDNLTFLEIGSYEGKSAIYMVEKFLTGKNSKIVCVDPFIFTYEYRKDFPNYEERFDSNTAKYGEKIVKRKGYSEEVLKTFEKESFDFIYVDGSHKAEDILIDANLSFKLLKPGGILAFDDYELTKGLSENEYPKLAIDRFLKENPNHEVLDKNWQVWIQRR